MSIMHNNTVQAASNTWPRLIADIGGTNARFALETAPEHIEHIDVLPCNNYPTVVDAARAYLSKIGNPPLHHAAIAIANPIVGDWVQMTNHHWAFSIEATRTALQLDTLLLLNDFTAQALAVTRVASNDLIQIGGGEPDQTAPKAILGPGTGLGVSGLIPDRSGGFTALAGEGGHVSFSPFDDNEAYVWQFARQKYGHVSAERFLSGAGLVLIYKALAQRAGETAIATTPTDISERALNGSDALCRQTLDMFCAILGTTASNLVLTLGARGGVYLCGGIIPRFIEYFKTSPFRSRFENKGRFGGYLAPVPAYIVLANYPGLTGASAALHQHLQARQP